MVGRSGVNGQTVEDQHVAGVDPTACPFAFSQCSRWDFRDMQILIHMFDNAEMMRTIQYLQRTQFGRTIVKRDPHGKALGITTHEPIILMWVDREMFAIRKD